MYSQIQLLNHLQMELERETSLLQTLRQFRATLPAGYLSYKRGHFYRGISHEGKRLQIPISDWIPEREQLISELQANRHLAKALPILESNCSCLENALRDFRLYDPLQIQNSLPVHYQDYDVTPLLLAGDINPQTWADEEYPKNNKYLQELKHFSEGGLPTRSKAEADIATMLERHKLLFRYEPLIRIGSREYSPDFCILHPLHRLLIFWEHFGMMDKPDYAYNTMEKLSLYAGHGYFLGLNLIMTYETKEHPLHFGHIRNCIEQHFFSGIES